MTRFVQVAQVLRKIAVAAATLTACVTLPATAQRTNSQPASTLTDAEFWDVFATRSERGGEFLSENFVSNEMTFQTVIPSLQRSLTPNGVYLGVGPEQNFTFIANLKPRLAIIFDIRRQNSMQHLMYKALFELSPTRAEFVARLFSRPNFVRPATNAAPKVLFDAVAAAPASDSAYQANRAAIMNLLKSKHGFALAAEDSVLLDRVFQTFYRAGPEINYGVRSAAINTYSPVYPAFGELQQATNADGVAMGFLATEENYHAVRDMQLRNLIIPVVGDFGGPSAIRSVGDFLRKKNMIVTAFYASNVEQYLFREVGASDRFYANLSALPFDTTTRIIRSVPPNGGDMFTTFRSSTGTFGGFGPGVMSGSIGGPGSFSVSIVDSAGTRITRVTSDSAGTPVTRVTRDTSFSSPIVFGPGTISIAPSGVQSDSAALARMRSLAATADSLFGSLRFGPGVPTSPGSTIYGPRIRGANLAVGLASMTETVEAFFAGRLKTYGSAIDMTRTTGWGTKVP